MLRVRLDLCFAMNEVATIDLGGSLHEYQMSWNGKSHVTWTCESDGGVLLECGAATHPLVLHCGTASLKFDGQRHGAAHVRSRAA